MNGGVRLLRVLLVAIGVGTVLAQVIVLPWLAWVMAVDYPEFAYLRYPLLALSVAGVVCVQVVLVSAWQLLGLVWAGTLFTEQALAPLDRATAATVAACVVVAAAFAGTAFGSAAQPGVALVELALIGGGLVVILALLVARRVLQQATGMQAELASVI